MRKKTHFAFGLPINWGFERWNWARYHPCVFEERAPEKTRANINYWEGAVGLWENKKCQIVGVVHTVMPFPNEEIFFQRRPGYNLLLDEIFEYAESTLIAPQSKQLRIAIYEYDDTLQAAAEKGDKSIRRF